MANYATLQAAIDAGTSNMTVLRNNSKNDDGTTTYATGIDWFKFNNVLVNNLYSSGNSWLGFGASAEQLKVNRRDCAVWYEYKETGMIGITKFFKFRWVGYSYYSQTGSNYSQGFDVFLFDNGQIFLNFYQVPSSNRDGQNQLICGSQTLNYTISATPCEFTFTPSDPVNGTGWSVGSERPDVDVNFKPSGNVVFTLNNYGVGGDDSLHWTGDTPTGTSLKLYTKVDNGAYTEIASSGGRIQGLPSSGTCTLYIKAELATTDVHNTPKLTSITLKANDDKKVLTLSFANPNLSPAIGPVSVAYDGLGGLQGLGGPSEAFSGDFTPHGLTWKGNQMETEHIEMSMSVNGALLEITYINAKHEEHIEMTLSANSVLTDIHDL